MPIHPLVTWAQRSNEEEPEKNLIYLTIQVQDPRDVSLKLSPSTLDFSAKSADDSQDYELKLEFFDEIDPENSYKHETGSHIFYVLRKKIAKAEFWPRLLKEKLKLHYIKTDFDKWVDEDEQEEHPEDDETENMMNMGGPGGPGGMDALSAMGGAGGMDAMSAMGGAGGAGGFDFSKLLGANGSGAGDFDISALANQIGQNVGSTEGDDEGEEEEEA